MLGATAFAGGTLARFSWLHLSDLHLGPRGSRLLHPEYREAFERDLRRLHERSGPWEAVFISGDLTQTGSQREFALLHSALESLWGYFRSLGSNPCLLPVPGELDFQRPGLFMLSAAEIRKAFRSQEKGPPEHLVREGFRAYTEWFTAWRGAHPGPVEFLEGLLPGDFAATVMGEGLRVGVLGLNAVFRHAPGTPESVWEIDVAQAEAAVGRNLQSWALRHDVLLLLTHPPPATLSSKPLTRLLKRLMPESRPFLHLCGGFYKDGWKEAWPDPPRYFRWQGVVQALSLFGETSTSGNHWGYAAGRLSASGLRLFPRAASYSKSGLMLGPDRLRENEETPDIPLSKLLPLFRMEAFPSEMAEEELTEDSPMGEAAPAPMDESTHELLHLFKRVAPEAVSGSKPLPPGVKLQQVLGTGGRIVSRLIWAPSGEALGIGLSDGHLAFWNPREQMPSWIKQAHPTEILDLAFSPDGNVLVSRSSQDVLPWSVEAQGSALSRPCQSPGHAVAWSSAGELATDAEDGGVWLWDTRTWHPRADTSWLMDPARVHCLAWSPTGRLLARGSDTGVSLSYKAFPRDGSAPRIEGLSLRGAVLDIAWKPAQPHMALAERGGPILVWDAQRGETVATLEGHTDTVTCVSFSFDGRLLASKSLDGTVRLWRTDTWAQLAQVDEPAGPAASRALAFSPNSHVLASLGADGQNVRLWELDIEALLNSQAPAATIHEVSAKVVLVGEGRAGKSCLALRMAEDRYEELDSTHGMRFWRLSEERLAAHGAREGIRRELILWDMGGQSEYQLVHQLFLKDSAAALMVMEPGRGERAMEEIEGWDQRLLAQDSARTIRKLLVGTKLDSEDAPADLPALEALLKRCQFLAYVATSARTGRGIPELKAALSEAVDWARIEKISRPELFQRLRQHLQRLREARRVVLTFPELEGELRREMGGEFDPEMLRAVVSQLARQGLVADTRMADGTRVLILEVEQVERYASSLILSARDNPHGVPAIDVAKVMSPAMQFPRIPTQERLRRDQELPVLDCVIELLLEHGLCLRHEGLLVFPSLFRPTQAESGADFSHAISLQYDFSGPIDNIYASLVTSLAVSRRFGPMRLWEDRAEFGRAGKDSSGVRRVRQGRQGARGHARLDVYFDTETPRSTRELFVNLVEEHLRERGVELLERLTITCACGRVFPEDIVRGRLQAGHGDIGCPACDRRTPLTLGAQQSRERNPELVKQLHALRTDIQEQRTQSITDTKVSMTEAKTMKPTQDTPLRILHLSDLHVGAGDDPLSLLQPLAADLRDKFEGLGVERLDYLVLSGDITNRAAPQEFEKAREFVSALIDQFGLTAERCILVPGNHDLDWDTPVYEWKKKRQVDVSRLKAGTFVEAGDGYHLRDDAKYPERFKNYSQHFYHPLTQKEYPLAPEAQCLSFLFSEARLQFLAMNSAWEIDEYFRDRSSISEKALSRGLAAADQELLQARKRGELAEGAEVLRLAVWHHPITGNEKMQADAFMSRLLQAGVRACLHGHVHEDRADLVNYLHSERRIHVVGAGSFGAPTHDRPESVPRLFNLLEVQRDLKRLRVHTRCLRKQGGAWEGWAVWPGERPGEKRTYYEVQLP